MKVAVVRWRLGGASAAAYALIGAAVELALIAALAFSVFVALGVVGSPWYRIVSVQGSSMAPAIAPGDLIVVAPPPSKIEAGMVLVLRVADQVVTHRVVAANADGSFATRGDANRVDDDWGGEPVRVAGRYMATIPWLGAILPVPDVSTASFVDRVGASMTVTVGAWPTPHLAASIHIVPKTIDLSGAGDITASVDSLPAPYALTQVDLASIQLCHQGTCAAGDGSATRDRNGHVSASFTRSALAGLLGTDRGDLVLVVQGKLTDGSTFAGQQMNRVTGAARDPVAPAGGAAPAPATAPPSPSPEATPMPSPTAAPATGPSSAPLPPTPSPSEPLGGTAAPTPSASPSPSDASSPSPGSSPAATPLPTPLPTPSAAPTPSQGDPPPSTPTPAPSLSAP